MEGPHQKRTHRSLGLKRVQAGGEGDRRCSRPRGERSRSTTEFNKTPGGHGGAGNHIKSGTRR